MVDAYNRNTSLHPQRAVVHVAPVLERVHAGVLRVNAVDRSVEPVFGLFGAVLRGRLVRTGPLERQRHREAREQEVHRRLHIQAAARDAHVARQLAPARLAKACSYTINNHARMRVRGGGGLQAACLFCGGWLISTRTSAPPGACRRATPSRSTPLLDSLCMRVAPC